MTADVTLGVVTGRSLRRDLMRWYAQDGRHDLPWRNTRDPYAVLVSEVMLQQTQVARVEPYFRAWMDRWPTAGVLAEASRPDVIRAWGGLGYNRRAVNLHMLAGAAVTHGFPKDLAGLRALPGIGPYTAAAVASFAFDQRVAVVETNVGRVVARAVLGVADARVAGAAAVHATAECLLPGHGVRDHNLALMDLGATVCSARAPACGSCPIRRSCGWRAAGSPASAVVAPSTDGRWADSARYARGRIVDALRVHQWLSVAEIGAGLSEHHRLRLRAYLRSLEHDGLVASIPGTDDWTLAGRAKEE